MIEVEIKIQISDPISMRKKFESNYGSYKFSLLHEDTYYNMPKGLRDFKQTDEALRLRKSIKFNKNSKRKDTKTDYFLTYKGKKIDTLTKTREEIDIKIENIEKMKEIFGLLGFQEVLTVKKERELFLFQYKNYNIEALIDFLPALGQYFVEVEYLSDSKKEIEESREMLFEFLDLFGIHKEDSIKKSYLELILENSKG
ncbi:MAG: class IV adenylate cyclase [Candidatus Lokiarchaeota archaeon]|nr:class IV adenylate cyclase [Candidatus Lokiarchaeota archaeon]